MSAENKRGSQKKALSFGPPFFFVAGAGCEKDRVGTFCRAEVCVLRTKESRERTKLEVDVFVRSVLLSHTSISRTDESRFAQDYFVRPKRNGEEHLLRALPRQGVPNAVSRVTDDWCGYECLEV